VSRRVTVRLAARRGGRPRRRDAGAGVGPATPTAAGSPPPERVPRVARVLALAHHWQGLIRSGAVRDQADLARLVGVSRARVSQVMRLLDLAPDIQQAVLHERVDGLGAELGLRAVAAESAWPAQRATWVRGCAPVAARSSGR
jgi:hypothetical protein